MTSRTREKLIDVARQLFAHKGMEKTTMNDIASASEKGRRTIYTYFKNKREIYDAVIESESEQLVSSLRAIASSDKTPDVKLSQFILSHFESEHPNQSFYHSIKNIITRDAKRIQTIKQLTVAKENEILDLIIAQGITDGVFDRDKCVVLKSFLIRFIQSIDLSLQSPDSADRQALKSFVDFTVNSLRP